MRNIVLSAVAVLAMSSFAVAGGDIAPVEEPMVEVVAPTVTDSGFYLGGAYSLLNVDMTTTWDDGYSESSDEDFNEIMLQAGYKFNSYVAVEGRYWMGVDDNTIWDRQHGDITTELDAWGIYVKPMYPVTDAFDVYALLGYASTDYTVDFNNGLTYNSDDLDGFSWGLGASYSFTDNIAIFVDYTSLYDDSYTVNENTSNEYDVDNTLQAWNFGVTYQF